MGILGEGNVLSVLESIIEMSPQDVPVGNIIGLPTGNYGATTDPTINDDSTRSYEVGSLWVNNLLDKVYICTNNSVGAAEWELTTGAAAIAASAVSAHNQASPVHSASAVGAEPALGLPVSDGLVLASTMLGAKSWVQSVLSNGSIVGASVYAQEFTNGVKTSKLFPPSNSTTAFGFYKADGTTKVLNIDTTNGRVGIGTDSPLDALHVSGGIRMATTSMITGSSSSDGYIVLSDSNYANMNIVNRYVYAATQNYGNIVIGTSSSERMRITNWGNVGIGNVTPTANFQVAQSTTGTGTVSVNGTAVTGVGTQFTNTFKVGDTITVTTTSGSETKAIATITSDTVLVTAAFAGTASGVSYTLVGGTRFSVLGNGNVRFGSSGVIPLNTNRWKTEIYDAIGSNSLLILSRGKQDGGTDTNIPTAYGTPYLGIGGRENNSGTRHYTIGFGEHYYENSYYAVELGAVSVDNSSYGYSDFVIGLKADAGNSVPITRFKIMGATGNVGIGTSTPAEKLSVAGNISATGTISDVNFSAITEVLDVELLSNGSFTGGTTGWTVNSGWAYGTDNVGHTSNGTAALSQTLATNPTSGTLLKFTFTVSNLTAGSLTAQLWWTTNLDQSKTITADGTYSIYVTVTGNIATNIRFVPSNDARFTLDSASLAAVTTVGGPVVNTIRSQILNLGLGTGTEGIRLETWLGAGGLAAAGTSKLRITNTAGSLATVYVGGIDANQLQQGSAFYVANVVNIAGNIPLQWTSNSGIANNDVDLILRRGGAATLQLGNWASATPVSQTIVVQGSRGGTDTDIAGGNLTIQSGLGTGSATGSTITFNTPASTTTGNTQQVATPRMTILGNGNVGIGTATPREALDIASGKFVMGTGRPKLLITNDTYDPIIQNSSDGIHLHITNAGSGFIFLNPGLGGVKIAGEYDFSRVVFDVKGSGTSNADTGLYDNTGTKRVGIGIVQYGQNAYLAFPGRLTIDEVKYALYITGAPACTTAVNNLSGGNIRIIPGSGASASVGVANGGSIYLDGGIGYGTGSHGNVLLANTRGNVGIGTSTPAFLLDVTGPTVAPGTFSTLIRLRNPVSGGATTTDTGMGSIAWYLSGDDNNCFAKIVGIAEYPGGTAEGAIAFWTNDHNSLKERIRITSSGNIGINTTAPLRKLDINAADGNCLRLIYNDSDGSAAKYADFSVNGAGDLNISPTTGVITTGNDLTLSSRTDLGDTSRLVLRGTAYGYANGGFELASGTKYFSTYPVGHSTITGMHALSSGEAGSDNGGNVQIAGGNGASASAIQADGGHVTLNGGIGYGTGSHGNVLLANTRGNVGIGTSSPLSLLHIKGDGVTLAIENTTLEDVQYGRESTLMFYGNTAAGTRHAQFGIQCSASNAGVGSQESRLDFLYNDGDDGLTPSSVFMSLVEWSGGYGSPALMFPTNTQRICMANGLNISGTNSSYGQLLASGALRLLTGGPTIGAIIFGRGEGAITEFARFDGNTGNLGLQTTSPTANLQVAQSTTGPGTISVSGTAVTGVGTQFTNTFKVGDTITVTTTSGSETKAIATITSDTALVTAAFAGTAAAGTAYTLVGGTRFSVFGNGRVGIGTTTPTEALQVVGNITGNQHVSALWNVYAGSVILGSGQLYFANGGAAQIHNGYGDPGAAIGFKVDSREFARLTWYGNLGIQTTTPTANFQVAQSTICRGTVSVSGSTVTGINTKFSNTFKCGDSITVTTTAGSETRTVYYYNGSDTVLEVTAPFTGTASGVAYTVTGGNIFSVYGNGGVSIAAGPNEYPVKLQIGTDTVFTGHLLKLAGKITSPYTADAMFEVGDGSNAVYWRLSRQENNVFRTQLSHTWGIMGANVGIGTTTPSNSLQVYNASSPQALFNGYGVIAGAAGADRGSVLLGNNPTYQGIIEYDPNSISVFTIRNSLGNGWINFTIGSANPMTMVADNVGMGTTAPLRKLDINSPTGNCLRLIHNDADGSAAYYADFLVSSAGELTIAPTKGVTVNKTFTTSGGRIGKITTVTDTYQVLITDETVVCNKATPFSAVLPVAVVGQIIKLKNIGAGVVTLLATDSDTIDGVASQIMNQWDSITVQCYAANCWMIL